MLNWQALKPTQVAGTIFNDLDDESVLAAVDMSHFEELFKTRAQDSQADLERMQRLERMKQRRGTTLIDTNRARNLAITLRKIGLDTESICKARDQRTVVFFLHIISVMSRGLVQTKMH